MHTVHKNMTRSHMVVVKLRVNTVCLKYKYIQANHHHTVTSLSTLDVPIPRLPAVLPYVTSLTCLGVSWGKHFFCIHDYLLASMISIDIPYWILKQLMYVEKKGSRKWFLRASYWLQTALSWSLPRFGATTIKDRSTTMDPAETI